VSGEARPFGIHNLPEIPGYWNDIKWQAAVAAAYSPSDVIRIMTEASVGGYYWIDEPFLRFGPEQKWGDQP
jgi:hypothetical protein